VNPAVVRAVEVEVDGMTLLMETAVTQVVGSEHTGVGDRTREQLLKSFDRMQDAVERVAVSTAKMIANTAKRAAVPDVVQVELGLKLSAKGDVIIAGSSGEASVKVTLTYNRGSVQPE